MFSRAITLVLLLAACGSEPTADLLRPPAPTGLFFSGLAGGQPTLVVAAGAPLSQCSRFQAGDFRATAETTFFWLSPPPDGPVELGLRSQAGAIAFPQALAAEPQCGVPLLRGTLKVFELGARIRGEFLAKPVDEAASAAPAPFDAVLCEGVNSPLPDRHWATDCGG